MHFIAVVDDKKFFLSLWEKNFNSEKQYAVKSFTNLLEFLNYCSQHPEELYFLKYLYLDRMMGTHDLLENNFLYFFKENFPQFKAKCFLYTASPIPEKELKKYKFDGQINKNDMRV